MHEWQTLGLGWVYCDWEKMCVCVLGGPANQLTACPISKLSKKPKGGKLKEMGALIFLPRAKGVERGYRIRGELHQSRAFRKHAPCLKPAAQRSLSFNFCFGGGSCEELPAKGQANAESGSSTL